MSKINSKVLKKTMKKQRKMNREIKKMEKKAPKIYKKKNEYVKCQGCGNPIKRSKMIKTTFRSRNVKRCPRCLRIIPNA